MNNESLERLKFRIKRLLDDCEEFNRSLCNQKGTQSAYQDLSRLLAKYEEGERSKKAWLAMQVLMETEASSMNARFDYVDAKEVECNEQLNKLSNLLSSLGEKIEEGEYHIKDMATALSLISKILDSVLETVQEVDSMFPQVNKNGANHLPAVQRIARQAKFKLEELIQKSNNEESFDSKKFGNELRVLGVVVLVEQKQDETRESEMSQKGLGFREMHISLDHKDVVEICQEIANSI